MDNETPRTTEFLSHRNERDTGPVMDFADTLELEINELMATIKAIKKALNEHDEDGAYILCDKILNK